MDLTSQAARDKLYKRHGIPLNPSLREKIEPPKKAPHIAPQKSTESVQYVRLPSRCLLSNREVQIITAIAEGYTNAEIGAALYLSVETVKSHVQHILFKLGARNRAQAVYLATAKYGYLTKRGNDV